MGARPLIGCRDVARYDTLQLAKQTQPAFVVTNGLGRRASVSLLDDVERNRAVMLRNELRGGRNTLELRTDLGIVCACYRGSQM